MQEILVTFALENSPLPPSYFAVQCFCDKDPSPVGVLVPTPGSTPAHCLTLKASCHEADERHADAH